MAWVEKLPSGNYRGVYRDKQAKRRYLDRTYTQHAEALRLANKKELDVRLPGALHPDAGKLTWGEWAEEWWPKRKVEPGSQKRDESRLRIHVKPRWIDVPLEAIEREEVQEWVEHLLLIPKRVPKRNKADTPSPTGKPLAASTVARIYAVFSASMKAAVKAKKISHSPCESIEITIPEPADERFLERDQYARLQAHAPDELAEMFNELAVGTGFRWGEVVGLHRHRINTKRLRIIVQEVYDQAIGDIKPYPKGRLRRGVPITKELATKIDRWMTEHPEVPCATPHRNGEPCHSGLLLPGADGKVLNYTNYRRDRWNPMVEAAGLPGISPHDLRHTYASWLIQDEVTIEQLSKLLGHKSILTTMRYAHLADAGWAKVREVLSGRNEELDDEDVQAAIRRLAEVNPDRWGAVARALDRPEIEGDEKFAPHLPHGNDERRDAKIINLASRRRSAS